MKKWLWTFTNNYIFAKKYIILTTDKDDGREILYQIYGQQNLLQSYSLDYEPYKEEEIREQKDYKKIGEWEINNNAIKCYLPNLPNNVCIESKEITDYFKHTVWDKMIGGI